MQDTDELKILVVVGDADLERRASQLLPSFRVLGTAEDLALADPATSLAKIGALLDGGRVPVAVLCSGEPGFTVLCQIKRFPANRFYVYPGGSPWPLPTLQCLVEAAGMTLLQDLESLPVALVGRTVEGVRRPGYGEIPTGSGLAAAESVERLRAAAPPGTPATAARPASQGARPAPAADDFGWAETPTVQVPPAPVSLETPETDIASLPRVVVAGEDQARHPSAYLPTDLLRALRPRSRSR